VSAAPQAGPPNVVVILTDDQRWDTMWAMPTVQSELVERGVTFANAFVVNPTCCPSRASFLTGKFSHSTGVYRNRPPYGAFASFDDTSTLATALHDGGYRTGLLGKYLNYYEEDDAAYVPPGWDRWVAFVSQHGNGEYLGYDLTINGSVVHFGDAPADYSTDVLAGYAANFIRSTPASTPLFLWLALKAPHGPMTPAPQYASAFSDLPPWRPPSYNEADVSDKPAYVQATPKLDAAARADLDEVRLDQYRTLLSADDAVQIVLDKLAGTGRLANTIVVFASDNGYLWGEHRWEGKQVPWEESLRIPLVIRFDALGTAPRTESRMALNVDLATTVGELAGVPLLGTDGRSLAPLLRNDPVRWRSDFLIEHLVDDQAEQVVPTYCAVRTGRYLFASYTAGEEELYDLRTDPFEVANVASEAAYHSVLVSLRARLNVLCQPPPPGG
jgi:arylsulfatase A-like enzyme